MRYMVVERFKPGASRAVYERARERGRMLPAGLAYIESWVSQDLRACYQLMECGDAALFDQWTRHWDDLIEFEIVPVVTSEEAARLASGISRRASGAGGC